MQVLNAFTAAKQFCYGNNTVVSEFLQVFFQRFSFKVIKLGVSEMEYARFQRPHALQHAFFEIGADPHDLARSFHLRAEGVWRIRKFIKGKTRKLCDDIVQRGFHGGGPSGNGNLFQSHSHGNFRGDPSDRISGCFGSQGRRTGNSGVHFDQIVLAGIGIQGKLDIAAAFNFQLPDDL